MSKAIMLSIQPKWCEKIARGEKTVEIRKTRPKMETPFKCYIYQTRKPVSVGFSGTGRHISEYDKTYYYNERSGKVIGEFVCDYIDWHGMAGLIIKEDAENTLKGTCLNKSDIQNYLGYDKDKPLYEQKHYDFYGWHISDLVIYDKPRELSEFYRISDKFSYEYCEYACPKGDEPFDPKIGLPCPECKNGQKIYLTKPPQSWCYVEDGGADNG